MKGNKKMKLKAFLKMVGVFEDVAIYHDRQFIANGYPISILTLPETKEFAASNIRKISTANDMIIIHV